MKTLILFTNVFDHMYLAKMGDKYSKKHVSKGVLTNFLIVGEVFDMLQNVWIIASCQNVE